MLRIFGQIYSWFHRNTAMASSGFKSAVVEDDGQVRIIVHPLTEQPTRAWEVIKVHQVHRKVQRLPLSAPIAPHKVRFVCVSDTHSQTDNMQNVPDGDVLIHAGDFTKVGRWEEVDNFNKWLGTLPHKYKIVIAGNHELSFEHSPMNRQHVLAQINKPKEFSHINDIKKLLTNCIYLEDSEVEVCGLRIYGTPWQPEFGGWAYNLKRGRDCLEKWDKIPEGVDILISHGPPIGHGDLTVTGNRAGCVELLHTVQHRVKPKYHIFGHIHEDPGITSDGITKFINASTCTLRYKATNPPIIFDLDLPEGHTKDDISFPVACSANQKEQPSCEQMETAMEDDIRHSFSKDPKHSKHDKAENFMDYCEVATVGDNLGNLDIGPNFN